MYSVQCLVNVLPFFVEVEVYELTFSHIPSVLYNWFFYIFCIFPRLTKADLILYVEMSKMMNKFILFDILVRYFTIETITKCFTLLPRI